jgi:hypothetical protein
VKNGYSAKSGHKTAEHPTPSPTPPTANRAFTPPPHPTPAPSFPPPRPTPPSCPRFYQINNEKTLSKLTRYRSPPCLHDPELWHTSPHHPDWIPELWLTQQPSPNGLGYWIPELSLQALTIRTGSSSYHTPALTMVTGSSSYGKHTSPFPMRTGSFSYHTLALTMMTGSPSYHYRPSS